MTFAVVFPGQGSQAIGMLSKLSEKFSDIKQTFIEASENLDYDLWAVTQQGPAERLNATACTQPALLAAGVALWRLWQAQEGPDPAFMAGHSLGEYSALVCTGSLAFPEGVQLVEFRGQAMQTAVPAGTGAMAAVLGLADEAVQSACRDAAQGQVVAPVNYNAPGQVVIAGHTPAVERATALCKSRGAKRVVPLPVSVPSHCSLMQPAAEHLAEKLTHVAIQPPRIPVIHNVDVKSHPQPAAIREVLASQLYNPVRWVETVQFLRQQGVQRLVELGPGGVLVGLCKRIDKGLEAYPVFDPETLKTALTAVKGG